MFGATRRLRARIKQMEIEREQFRIRLDSRDRELEQVRADVEWWKREYNRCAEFLDEKGPLA